MEAVWIAEAQTRFGSRSPVRVSILEGDQSKARRTPASVPPHTDIHPFVSRISNNPHHLRLRICKNKYEAMSVRNGGIPFEFDCSLPEAMEELQF